MHRVGAVGQVHEVTGSVTGCAEKPSCGCVYIDTNGAKYNGGCWPVSCLEVVEKNAEREPLELGKLEPCVGDRVRGKQSNREAEVIETELRGGRWNVKVKYIDGSGGRSLMGRASRFLYYY
jgi:hypothetical protein